MAAPNPPSVNRAELRALVQGAFSAGKIVELAAAWGIEAPLEWSRSSSEAAHGLLREGERKLGIQECIRRLRAADPLIEWPSVDDAASAEWGPPSVRGAAAADPDKTPIPSSPPRDPEAPMVSPPGQAGSAPAGPTVAAEPLPSAMPAATDRPAATTAPFPGTVATEPKRQGMDPKILVAVVGGVLAIALLAFGAGLLWSRGGDAKGAASSAAPSGSARVGPALLAAMVLEENVIDVAARCSVPYEAHQSREVLGLAISLCDRKTIEPEEPLPATQPRPRADRDDPKPGDPDEPTRTSRPAQPRDPAPRPPAAGGGCLGKCKSTRTSCMSACGHEPSDASKYDEYAGCTSKCVSAESRCRLSCN